MLLIRITSALLSACLASTVAAQQHPVMGAAVGVKSKGVPYRLNINHLQSAAGPQWDLYIQAIQTMQDMDSADDLSWFQIAAIHGMPFNEWDGAGPKQGDGWLGYCPHGEGIFVSWHRPYVMLFEQELVRHAIGIAKSYPIKQRAKYMGAAQALRAPFWDWAVDEALLAITVPTTLSINLPSGDTVKKVDVKNPFQTYAFPKAALDKKYGRFPRNSQTIERCNKAGQTFPDTANAKLKSLNLKSNLYAAYANTKTFEQFVATSDYGVGMEQCHNWIHNEATCRGSFAPSVISAFEPLFMLHHSNIDRLWAYWQYMQPNETIFTQSYSGQSRWGTPTNAVITPDSPLLPFRYSNGSYYTSRSVSDLAGRGYTYQGLEFWVKSAEDLRKSATTIVNTAWGPSRNAGKRGEQPSVEGHYHQYFVRLGLNREDVERPSSIDVYINKLLAGTIPVMAQPAAGSMKGSFVADNFVARALASLSNTNSSLHDIAHLVALKVTKPDGSVVPVESIPSLTLALEEVDVTPSQSISELPTIGEPRTVSIMLRNHM